MPTYVYECAKCGDEFELYQSFSEDPLKKHPRCGGKVAKVFQPVGIVLKGSGFYKNDSRNGAKRAKGDDSSKPEKTEKTEKSEKSDAGAKTDSSSTPAGSSSGNGDSKSSSSKTDSAKPSTPAAKST
jgi:putative FmdB family regulatory protein